MIQNNNARITARKLWHIGLKKAENYDIKQFLVHKGVHLNLEIIVNKFIQGAKSDGFEENQSKNDNWSSESDSDDSMIDDDLD